MTQSALLAKLVSTAGTVSSGAVRALATPSRPRTGDGSSETLTLSSADDGLRVVPRVMELLASTLSAADEPSAAEVERVAAHLHLLVEHYGTVRRAIESIGDGRRRYPIIDGEVARAWRAAMLASAENVSAALAGAPELARRVGAWLDAAPPGLAAELDAYARWLDGPLPEPTPAPAASRLREAGWHELRPCDANVEAIGLEDSSSAATEEEDVHGYVGEWIPATESTRRHADPDVGLLWHHVFEDKRPTEMPGDRQLWPEQRAAIERLRVASDPYARAVAAIAAQDFGLADTFLPHLEGRVDAALLAMLRGHRYDLEGRHDEAVEQYRLADPGPRAAAGRRALAVALLGARRGHRRTHVAEAVQILRDLLDRVLDDSLEAARAHAILGYALIQQSGPGRAGRIREAIQHLERAEPRLDPAEHPRWHAETMHHLGAALLEVRGDERPAAFERAIRCLEDAVAGWALLREAGQWAAAQTTLGIAWERRPGGDPAANLQNAVQCLTSATRVRTRETHPVGWARLQCHLGDVWMHRGHGDRAAAVRRAIASYSSALEIWSREHRRQDWAASQHALGAAWAALPSASREQRRQQLRRAISCYRSALEVRSRGRTPIGWAATHHALGMALLRLAGDGDQAPLHDAIECLTQALHVRSRERTPVDWARTQAGLGEAWARLRGGSLAKNLRRATLLLRAALDVFDPQQHAEEHERVSRLLAEIERRLAEADPEQ